MDTQALQTLVVCGGVVTLPRLTFRVDKPIVLRSGTVIDGTGAVVDACHGGYVFLVSDAHDVCIRNLEIRGDRTSVDGDDSRSEEHSLNSSHLVISYAVLCLK